MRFLTGLKWTAVGAALVLATGSATAQQPAPAPPIAPAGQVPFEQHPSLSPQEEDDQGEAVLTRMDQSSQVVRRELEQAREARDVVKTLCLNDKLSQIDVAIRSGRDREAGLHASATRNPPDVEFANHEFTILTVLKQRSDQLVAEANQCLGEELAFVGATQVITQIDPNLPGQDTTEYPSTDPTLVSAPPQCISCSQ
jgi:hypothetical protein